MSMVFRWTEAQFRAFCNGQHHGDKAAAKADIASRGYTLIIYTVRKAA